METDMRISAIVYTSNTGHTERYAKLLADKIGLPAYSLKEARAELSKKAPVIYMGWLFAGRIKDCAKAKKRYDIRAVVGVGLCDTGCLIDEARRATKLSEELPLFTVQGGMDLESLRGVNKFMISSLTKMLESAPQKSESDERMLSLLRTGGDFVSEENLSAVLAWLEGEKE